MKVLSILMAWVNSIFAALVLLSCLSVSGMSAWLAVKVTAGALVILVGVVTLRDGSQAIGLGKMLAGGLLMVILGVSSMAWGVHLSVLKGDVQNVMLFFGGCVLVQGISSVAGLRETWSG